MNFVTAAFGQKYWRFVRGLINSFAKYVPGARLTVFSDADLATPSEFVVTRSISLDDARTWCNGFHPPKLNWVKLLALREAFREGETEACWIDCDQLVLGDLRSYLQPGVNCVRYGYGDEMRDCGGGLFVPQNQYVISGLFSLQSEDLEHLIRLAKKRRHRQLTGIDARLCDQPVLNHFVQGRQVNYLDNNNAVFDLSPWEGHPDPNSFFRDIQLQGEEGFWIKGRRIVVLYLMAYLLSIYLRNGFGAIKDPATRLALVNLFDGGRVLI